MEKIVILVLIAVNVVASCSSEQAEECAYGYNACVATPTENTTALFCSCYGSYALCLLEKACLSDAEYQMTVEACANSGCTRQQCLGGADAPVDVPVTFTPVASSSCDLAVAESCYETYKNCSGRGTLEEFCNCYGPYLYCYYTQAGCLTASEYEEAVQYCELYGCSAEQCFSPTSSPISYTPIDAPFSTPYSDPNNDECTQSAILACYDNVYQPCELSVTNSSDTCDCYGPYLYCLYEIKCYNGTGYEQNIHDCVQYGCSYQQCSNTGGLTPIESPTMSVPISAPFSAPSTVICLQPWELVLIVVGSLLAGVGLAAIIGVIIYLSRGRSGVKKTNKYAKLQQY